MRHPLVLALSIVLHASMVVAKQFDRWQQLAPGVKIAWTVKHEAKKLHFAMAANNTGWVGFGIAESGGMKGSDIVYFESGSNKLVDAWADGHSAPKKDSCQDWILLAGGNKAGQTWFEAERPLDTGDAQDRIIRDDSGGAQPTRIIAAWGESMNIQFHGGSQRAFTTVRFFGAESSTDTLAVVLFHVELLAEPEYSSQSIEEELSQYGPGSECEVLRDQATELARSCNRDVLSP